jgi:signal transduction histidine kinase
MVVVIAGALCVVVVFGTVCAVKLRRAREMDKVMRDYVRRAY